MSSVMMADLEAALLAMQMTKPPGVSGSKIVFITDLCVNNVQSESVIIQKLYTHFKKCPGTHKLGPLYVVDSITRKYLELAKKNNQDVSPNAPDGTFAAGVYRITNLLIPLMNDILQHAPPDENKDKIEKLYAIWERSLTFPDEILKQVKQKMESSPMWKAQINESSTPPGSPPKHLQNYMPQQFQSPAQAPPQPQSNSSTDVASMLQAIAQMAKQNQSVISPPPPQQDRSPPPAPVVPQYSLPTTQPQAPQVPTTLAPPPLGLPFTTTPPNANGISAYQPPPMLQMPQMMFPPNPAQPGFPQFMQQAQQPQQPQMSMEQLALLQLILQQPGIQNTPQFAPALQALLGATAQGFQMPQMPNLGAALGAAAQQPQQMWPQVGAQQQQPQQQQQQQGFEERVRDRGYSPPPRSPPRYSAARRGRSRSRSPGRFGREEPRSPPNFRRRSPVYGEYEGNDGGSRGGAPGPMNSGNNERGGTKRGGRRGRGGAHGSSPNRGRERSPQRTASVMSSPPPQREQHLPKVPKNVQFVNDIGPNSVRVLSRTLFVGGVTINDDELRQLFEKFGQVQSCIVNQDKRHAFIKMLTREDAVKAKSGMETYRTDNMTLRTRWGVGFGPRDCSDYQTGVSVIPIDRLTEADQRWMVSAEYGGTGGQPLQGGMCVEEPDIEIGQGVSSKAISKRFPTDSGGNKGPRSTHDSNGPHNRKGRKDGNGNNNNSNGNNGNNGNNGGNEHHKVVDPNNQRAPPGRESVGVAPPTPGFGAGFPFQLPMMNGVAGFQYPGFTGNTQPPAGR
ncbi:hypothetical protein FPQ18DRAFT_134072 [Pyronema domesticum]|uniref:Similar to Rpb7-binding protein seb1 acc. no. Q9UTE3 n=1 Tax=Pyronema omphalodes (strain CBS 100304) TaxID=1076935 RepID=U4KTW2_PYROM|nr:hypothetical protein FPQ18DRAFT_134072 [Pyronema domesticum]CCX04237.1 Similar to Rpb7-binding protein seb1; acc. no. Q9UTE3 [Pyronema omphalodes CBS 100304]